LRCGSRTTLCRCRTILRLWCWTVRLRSRLLRGTIGLFGCRSILLFLRRTILSRGSAVFCRRRRARTTYGRSWTIRSRLRRSWTILRVPVRRDWSRRFRRGRLFHHRMRLGRTHCLQFSSRHRLSRMRGQSLLLFCEWNWRRRRSLLGDHLAVCDSCRRCGDVSSG
jgi:hypothetical protein